ncbi:hypothetical protein FOZ60_013720 [Perkinsus olseni]|uniref:Uncharacterized protein n=1 Tax=Perkinsus olseni TaxID=32597 RepID=A0A7J6P880_PEROL|nr:hypothetical protein FOZ60_013720 [Perkinsus olseni]
MLTGPVILSLLGLVISSVPPSSSPSHDLEFYKEISYPWDRLEEPRSIKGGEACPVTQYTWDFYFKYLIDITATVRSGYSPPENSSPSLIGHQAEFDSDGNSGWINSAKTGSVSVREISNHSSVIETPETRKGMGPSEFTAPIHDHPELYKVIKYPWHLKEVPICFNSTLCPSEANYTWDYYFDYLTDVGVRSFVLGGYAIRKSRIAVDPEFYPPWNKTGFNELRRRVDAVGGRILADLGVYGDKTFDKKAFLESAAKFTEDYRVDGFQLKVSFWDSDVIPPLKEAFKAIKELRLHSSLW